MSLSEVLFYLSSALIVLWTAQTARMKRRNPWLWGGAALGLLLLSLGFNALQFLGALPLLFLFFVPLPQSETQQTEPSQPESSEANIVSCPNCQVRLSASRRYCTNCGWDLQMPYAESAETASKPVRAPEPAPAVAEAAAEKPAPTEPAPVPPVSEEPAPAPEPEPEPEPEPPRPVYSGPPTPTRLTERGITLLEQGKAQEAIDQFSKALALNPSHKEALLRRAEAYTRQGRHAKATEDQRAAASL